MCVHIHSFNTAWVRVFVLVMSTNYAKLFSGMGWTRRLGDRLGGIDVEPPPGVPRPPGCGWVGGVDNLHLQESGSATAERQTDR